MVLCAASVKWSNGFLCKLQTKFVTKKNMLSTLFVCFLCVGFINKHQVVQERGRLALLFQLCHFAAIHC